jgi:hypothetical protein
MRVGIAAGQGGLCSRICRSSSSHYASVCADKRSSIGTKYPNYWGFFRRIADWPRAETSWTWVVVPRETGGDLADRLRVLERAAIAELQPIWEEPGFKSRAAYLAAAPALEPLVEAWCARNADKAPWQERLAALLGELGACEPKRMQLRRVALDLSPDAVAILEAAAADQDASMAEVVELLVRRELRPAAGAHRGGKVGPRREIGSEGGAAVGGGLRVGDCGWGVVWPRLRGRGVRWNEDKTRGSLTHPGTGRLIVKDMNINTMKGYIYPPPTYARPAHLTVYKADNAINVRELTLDELDALLDALHVPRAVTA